MFFLSCVRSSSFFQSAPATLLFAISNLLSLRRDQIVSFLLFPFSPLFQMGSHSRGPREGETISRRAVALSRESGRGRPCFRSRAVGRQNTPFPSSFYFSSGPSFPRFLISTLHLPPLHSGGPFSPFGSNSSRCQTNKKRTRGVDMPRPISPSSNSSDRSPLFLFKHFPPFSVSFS